MHACVQDMHTNNKVCCNNTSYIANYYTINIAMEMQLSSMFVHVLVGAAVPHDCYVSHMCMHGFLVACI